MKGLGSQNVATATNPYSPSAPQGSQCYTYTHNWKVKNKSLTYDESDGSNYPENYLPLIGFVAFLNDGTPVTTNDQSSVVNIALSHHAWYKDA